MNNKEEEILKNVIDNLKEKELSTLSDVISKIMKVINDPKSSTLDLANIFQSDQVLSTKLLRVANSAYYNPLGKKIDELRTAIIRVGYNGAQEIAMSSVVSDLFQTGENIEDYSRIALWKHSVAVALSNKLIYSSEFKSSDGVPYLCGLLHDIGIVIEDQFLHDGFKRLLLIGSSNKGI